MNISPAISVVMSVFDNANQLPETVDSVLTQTDADFEFIVVNDGSPDPRVGDVLAQYAERDERIRVITKSNEGLTRALIDGCAAARGRYIARIDNGDVMLPNRLEKQRSVLDAYPEAVLVTCWTEYCGPDWEHLYTTRNKMMSATGEDDDWVATVLPPVDGEDLADGPTSHPSVMYRADAYLSVGGYRAEFYYGQDWDLWYRLAERGKFSGVQAVLYRCRIFPSGISMKNAGRQREIHACSRGAFRARQNGENETPYLEKAASIRPRLENRDKGEQKSLPVAYAAGYYFIGEALRRNRDQRCRHYFRQAIYKQPFCLRNWIRFMQGLFV